MLSHFIDKFEYDLTKESDYNSGVNIILLVIILVSFYFI